MVLENSGNKSSIRGFQHEPDVQNVWFAKDPDIHWTLSIIKYEMPWQICSHSRNLNSSVAYEIVHFYATDCSPATSTNVRTHANFKTYYVIPDADLGLP